MAGSDEVALDVHLHAAEQRPGPRSQWRAAGRQRPAMTAPCPPATITALTVSGRPERVHRGRPRPQRPRRRQLRRERAARRHHGQRRAPPTCRPSAITSGDSTIHVRPAGPPRRWRSRPARRKPYGVDGVAAQLHRRRQPLRVEISCTPSRQPAPRRRRQAHRHEPPHQVAVDHGLHAIDSRRGSRAAITVGDEHTGEHVALLHAGQTSARSPPLRRCRLRPARRRPARRRRRPAAAHLSLIVSG